MAALDTVAKMVASVRVLIQDTIEDYRYSDTDILEALNIGLLEMRRIRPDIFLYTPSTIPEYSVVNTTPIAIDQQYLSALRYYIAGQVQLRDDEDTQDSRALGFISKFNAQLLVVTA